MKRTHHYLAVIIIIFAAFSLTLSKQTSNEPYQNEEQTHNFPFQRTIWTYWNSPNGSIPLIVKICFDNIRKVAQKYNFTFICLNESTVTNYISNYDAEFIQVRKNSIQNSPAHAADLLRIILIEQQGGIWVDSTTIFLNGLGDLQNIMSQKYSHLIANRFSPQPDVLLFYYSQGQNRIQQWVEDPKNSSNKILYNPYPDYEIWMIAAKKKAKFITEVKNTYQQWTTTNFSIISKMLIDQDIYMHRIDNFGNYLYLNMVVSYVQQRKQFELDQNLTLNGLRLNAFEHYKIWGLHSEYGPMLTTREDISPIRDLLEYSAEEIQKEKGMKFLFFMKQFGYFRYVMGFKLDILIEIYEKRNLTFDQFLASKPSGEWCENTTWLVEGSIMDKMIRNSNVKEVHKFPTISKAQNQLWKQYCRQNGTLFSYIKQLYSSLHIQTLIISIFMPDKIHKAKVNSILNMDKKLTFSEKLKVLLDDNAFLIVEFFYILIVVLIIWVSYKKALPIFQRRVRNVCSNSVDMDNPSEFDVFSSKNKSKSVRRASRQLEPRVNSWMDGKYSYFTFFILLFTMVLYNAVDVLGGFDQPGTFLMFLCLTFWVQSFLEHKFKEDEGLAKYQHEYELFYILVNYMLTYIGLCSVRKNKFWLNWFSIVLGTVGPCVLKLKREINAFEASDMIGHKENDKETFWSIRKNKFRYMTLTLLGLFLMFPNIKYLANAEGYYVQKIPVVVTGFLGFTLVYVMLKCFEHKFYQELGRLVFLLGICLIETTYCEDIDFIAHNHSRILHVFRLAVVFGVVYQMMGCEFKYVETQGAYLKKSQKKKWQVYFGVLLFEVFPGRLLLSTKFIFWTKWEFLEHLLVIMYGVYLMALFMKLEKRRGKKSEPIEYTEVEMDNLSEQE